MKRILFVDDEPHVLDGLRQSLRGKRKVWDMFFVTGGVSALAEIERAPFDVIVSDMRMPGMDGAELLRRAAIVRPHAARIVLSGQMTEESIARAAGTAHRFLAKPCDRTILIESIERVFQLQDLLPDERIRACIGGIDSLPSLPGVHDALAIALTGGSASPLEVAVIIEEDLAVSAKVLQLVNSGFFGMPGKITSIAHAVRHMGLATLRNLVLSNSICREVSTSPHGLLVRREQEHALQCARLARQILAGRVAHDTAFTGGLLHDVGALVLASRFPDECASIHGDAKQNGVTISDAETRHLGFTHAQVGAYLLALWNLPDAVIDIVASHHEPFDETRGVDAHLAVRLAHDLSIELVGEPAGGPPRREFVPQPHIERLGLAGVMEQARANIVSM